MKDMYEGFTADDTPECRESVVIDTGGLDELVRAATP